MQWVIKNLCVITYHADSGNEIEVPIRAWVFFKLMNVSGAEAVVAAASPWVGLGESACLVRPYVDLMTESEIHLIMTSGMLIPLSLPSY
jgi:nucleoside permease NupC